MNDNFIASQVWLAASILHTNDGIKLGMLVLGLVFWTLYIVEKYFLRKP